MYIISVRPSWASVSCGAGSYVLWLLFLCVSHRATLALTVVTSRATLARPCDVRTVGDARSCHPATRSANVYRAFQERTVKSPLASAKMEACVLRTPTTLSLLPAIVMKATLEDTARIS